MRRTRAAVVGSGPNGLTAACVLARAGWEVTVYETAQAPGGALRSAEILDHGVTSDMGASVHPFAIGSPAFDDLGLAEHGLTWAHTEIPAAHALGSHPPVFLHSDVDQTAAELGVDQLAWRRLIGPVAEQWEEFRRAAMAPPLRTWAHLGEDSLLGRVSALTRLGLRGAWPADVAARLFRTDRARALFAGMAAHSTVPLSHPLTAAFGVLFAAAGHAAGWPVARGGSQSIVNALVAELLAHGGRIETSFEVTSIRRDTGGRNPAHRIAGLCGNRAVAADEVADVVVADVTPAQLLRLEGPELSSHYRRALRRWTYGPAIVKVDYLIQGTIPWFYPQTASAGTVHLGGSHTQISASESAAARGVLSGRPYVLLAQPSAADETRAPAGQTVAWAYAHVPHGLAGEGAKRAAEMIDAEISANAPGFRDAVLARKVWSPQDLQSMNANLVGGAISGGMPTVRQFLARPALSWQTYSTSARGLWMCSSSTPPGGGAHGMNGYNAAQAVLNYHR